MIRPGARGWIGRGISKEPAALDEWLIDLAPSTASRKWFHRELASWPEFGTRYRAELRAAGQRVTLLYAARDAHINHALVQQDVLRESRIAAPAAQRRWTARRRCRTAGRRVCHPRAGTRVSILG